MHFPFLHFRHPVTNTDPDEHPLVVLHEPELNTSEGGEFIDDGLRMEDIGDPLPPSEEEK